MTSVRAPIHKRVKQLDDMAVIPRERPSGLMLSELFDPGCLVHLLRDLLQNLHFIVGCFQIVFGAFLDFDGNIGVIFKVFAEPDGGKVPPAKLLNGNIAVG